MAGIKPGDEIGLSEELYKTMIADQQIALKILQTRLAARDRYIDDLERTVNALDATVTRSAVAEAEDVKKK